MPSLWVSVDLRFKIWDLLHRWIGEIEQESKIFASPGLLSESKYPFLGGVKKAALALPDAPNVSEILAIASLMSYKRLWVKKYKLGLRTTVNLFGPGILAGVLGDRLQDLGPASGCNR